MKNNNGFTVVLILLVIIAAMVVAVASIGLYREADTINKRLIAEINHAPDSEIIIEECLKPEPVATTTEVICDTTELEGQLRSCWNNQGVDISLLTMCEGKITALETENLSLQESRTGAKTNEANLLTKLLECQKSQ